MKSLNRSGIWAGLVGSVTIIGMHAARAYIADPGMQEAVVAGLVYFANAFSISLDTRKMTP